mgnify:FL=1
MGTLARDYGGDAGVPFAEYRDDDSFKVDMEALVKTALERVKEYRKFSDMEYAKKCLQEEIANQSKEHFWKWYHLVKLCFLKGDYEDGKAAFERYLEILKNSIYTGNVYIEWKD